MIVKKYMNFTSKNYFTNLIVNLKILIKLKNNKEKYKLIYFFKF